MHGVIFGYLGLTDNDIIALTAANFSTSTDPKNSSSVYKGLSAYTRCCWEIKIGHVVSSVIYYHHRSPFKYGTKFFLSLWLMFMLFSQDLCLGDFRETFERRAVVEFTSPFFVDRLLLVTLTKPYSSSSALDFGSFETSR